MAGHSHASNVKYKKDRSHKVKSGLFLKLRRRIELIYTSTNSREKVFTIAREYNFPKEKANSIIEKIEGSGQQNNNFTELLYRGKYEVLVYLHGSLTNHQENMLGEKIRILSLEKLHIRRLQDYFYPTYLLRIDIHENAEEIILSSLSAPVIDKIIKIERKGDIGSKFVIFFSEKTALAETVKIFTNNPNTCELEAQEIFSPFSPVYIGSDDFFTYFSLLETIFSEFSKKLQIFTNVSNKKKWDHSSVG